MMWFWIGYFVFVACLLALDLGVLNKGNKEPTLQSATAWTAGWVSLGLGFAVFVYAMYDNHWMGAGLAADGTVKLTGGDAAITYISAYLLEEALSVDNIFVISLLFSQYRVEPKYQHRVLFWGIIGAVVFRVLMLTGGAWLVKSFDWVFYFFGAYLAYAGLKLFKDEEAGDAPESPMDKSLVVRVLRKVVNITDKPHDGKFRIDVGDGTRALTSLAICLIAVELTDLVFALDSIPAVLAISNETFIMVTSNIFAIMGLRSLYFVLAGAMSKFHYLKYALAVLLILIGAKLIMHHHYKLPHVWSLTAIVVILAAGVVTSIISTRRQQPH
ncbi:MAG: TerC/Alx family metal homeostasis membrane protein [Myxococcales bacterium]|nr:TerC/Alx family metal homeostasis membrane protein [Myxococcales bacterium]